MKYIEALEKIERWLDEKKIREHCQTKCKGECCFAICKNRCNRPPLPCAIFLCNELRAELFGFHNGEKYHNIYLQVTGIVFGTKEWDIAHMGKVANDLDIDIPDKMIKALVTMEYEPDIHGGDVCGGQKTTKHGFQR